MIAAWMLVSALLGGAVMIGAVALDGVCRVMRVSRRWTWIGSLALLAALTILVPLRRVRDPGTTPLPAALAATVTNTSRPIAPAPAAARAIAAARALVDVPVARLAAAVVRVVPPALDRSLLVGWVGCSVLLLAIGGLVLRRLLMAHRTWPVALMHGERVHVAPDAGPAVLGFARGAIVVPRWLVDCTADVQEVVVAHEREHVRARDPIVLIVGAAAVMLVPWNPAAWWMLARLRLAVELDCDRRVLDGGVRTRDYGTLLIDLAGRTAGIPLAAPLVGLTMLAERTTHLERRIVAMSAPRPRHAAVRIAAGSLVALAAALVACESRLPTEADVNNMTAVSAKEAAANAGLIARTDSAASYYIDGHRVDADAASRLTPDQIASIRVQHDTASHATGIWIATQSGAHRSATSLSGASASVAAPGQRNMLIQEKVQAQTFAGLYIVDGRRANQREFAALQLNPSEIVSVEVIKGPRAAEMYPGDPAAAQGVIQITTKRGAH